MDGLPPAPPQFRRPTAPLHTRRFLARRDAVEAAPHVEADSDGSHEPYSAAGQRLRPAPCPLPRDLRVGSFLIGCGGSWMLEEDPTSTFPQSDEGRNHWVTLDIKSDDEELEEEDEKQEDEELAEDAFEWAGDLAQ